MEQRCFRWCLTAGVEMDDFLAEKLVDDWKLQAITITETVDSKANRAIITFFKINENDNITLRLF